MRLVTPARRENLLVMFIASLPFVLEPTRVCVIAFGKEVTRRRKRQVGREHVALART
jgi:hypothetical protein